MTTARKPRHAPAAFAAGLLPAGALRAQWVCGSRSTLGARTPPPLLPTPLPKAHFPVAVLERRRTAVATTAYSISPTAGRVPPRVAVEIERPAKDVRVIRARVLVHAPVSTIWGMLSDYAALGEHIPNLAESAVLSQGPGRARVSQCGVQSILGFSFKASVTMDMREVQADSRDCRAIEFSLVNSRDFKAFNGVWKVDNIGLNRSALFYDVTVSPRGLVPVRAIEWRISEDLPGNMEAVKRVCEARHRAKQAAARRRL